MLEIAENVVGGAQPIRPDRGQIERVDAITVVGAGRQRNGEPGGSDEDHGVLRRRILHTVLQ